MSISPTPYQARVMSIPAHWNVLLCGGRGGGKSTAALLLVLRHVEQVGEHARPLIIRDTHKAVSELYDNLGNMLFAVYGKAVKQNRAELTYRLPNSAIITLGQLDGPVAARKWQGKSFTLILADEFGLLGSPKWVDMLKSNLRAADGIPLREVRTANPGGPLHSFIHSRYIAKQLAWHPYEVDGEIWVNCPSTYLDNHHLNGEDYLRRLRASAGQDEALLKAWVEGDWNIARGAFFADVIDQNIHMLPAAWPHPITKEWKSYVAMDWGSSAPSAVYLCLRATGDHHLPNLFLAKNSLILLDEISTAHPNDPTVGLGWPPGKLAEAIVERCEHWGVNKHGVSDDATGLMGESLLQVFENYNLYMRRPKKGRQQGWALMREMLHNAKERNGRPGLYVTQRCKMWWATVPFLPRDELRMEDVDTNACDHFADASRYAVMELTDLTGMGNSSRGQQFFHPLAGLVYANGEPEQHYRHESRMGG
jgi:hypothetical protein